MTMELLGFALAITPTDGESLPIPVAIISALVIIGIGLAIYFRRKR